MTQNSRYLISIDPIKDIPFDNYQKDFTFIVNGKEYQTTRFLADFLSPIIRQYHFSDSTIDQFYIDTFDKSNKTDFSEILSLIKSDEKILSKEEVEFFIEIFIILGNEREISKLIPKTEEEITIENVFQIIQNKQKYFNHFCNNQSRTGEEDSIYYKILEILQPELDFISSHFYEIDQENILHLDIKLFECIIKSDKLKLEDEDSLLKIINNMYSNNSKYSYLYSYVNFLFANEELNHFYSIFNINDITLSIWRSLFERTLKSQINKDELGKYEKFIEKRYNKNNIIPKEKAIQLLHTKGDEFNGIIKYLTNKTGGNIHDNGTIEVSTNTYSNEPKYLLDFNYDNHYYANQNNDAWVCFDFKNRKIKLTNYSIKSCMYGVNSCHLKSWDVDVSNDGNNWIKIDERKNCNDLNGREITGTFDAKSKDFYRYVRIHQTDKTFNSCCLRLFYVEFYGYLLE